MPETTTFLLVEDDPNDISLLEMELRHCPSPIHLMSVNDGEQAIHYLQGKGVFGDRSTYPLPDVILLDIKMPRINGFQFLEWLRGQSPAPQRCIPVVIMSSSGLREDVEKAYALGANSYMVKPIGWTQFKERVKALGLYWAEYMETPECYSGRHG